jgi:hypothetical protein
MTKTRVQKEAGENYPGSRHDIYRNQAEGQNKAWINRADYG